METFQLMILLLIEYRDIPNRTLTLFCLSPQSGIRTEFTVLHSFWKSSGGTPPPAGSPTALRAETGGGAPEEPMSSFQRLNVQRARRPSADGGEGSVWRRFRHPLTFRHKAAPTHVEFSPQAPHDFAVASSLQVDIFSTRTTAIYRSLTRFKDVVHCCSYRGDGKMLAAGDDAGTVQIFDLGSRAVMRTFRGHQRAVHVARFAPDGANVFTASDDQRAICWDVAAESQVRRFDGHTDFVRCGALNPNSPKMLVTGSYDHTVRLWDVNSPKCVMELQHAAPIEVRAAASCAPHEP